MTLILAATLMIGLFDGMPMTLLALLVYAFGAGFAFTSAFAVVTDLATSVGLNQGYSAALTNVGWAGSLIIGAAGGGALLGAGDFLLAASAMAGLILIAGITLGRFTYPEPVSEEEELGLV